MAPIVFLPGFLCDARLWHLQLAHFHDRDCRVVDLRFCNDFEAMIQSIAQLDSPRFHLVGFSMGGYVAQVFAVRFPHRIITLTSISSSGGPLSEHEIHARQKMESLLQRGRYKGISTRELQRYLHRQTWPKLEVTELIHAMSAANTSAMYLSQMRATLHREPVRHQLQKLAFPRLIVGGEDDLVVAKEELIALHAEIPRAKFQLLSPCGHYVPLEMPDELNALLAETIGRDQTPLSR